MTQGVIQTVLGPIDPDDAGVTLPHEHLLCDLSVYFEEPDSPDARTWAHEAFTADRRWASVLSWFTNLDNLQLDDPDLLLEELKPLASSGVRTLVDLTTHGLAPDPAGVAEISRRSGINIVLGTGYYIDESHPPDMSARSVEDLAAEMQQEIDDGIGSTGVRAGIIGELGYQSRTANERKVLRAAAKAQRMTGAAVNVHVPFDLDGTEAGLEAADVLEDAGADLGRVIFSHQDASGADPHYQDALLGRGVTLVYDCFGIEMTTLALGGIDNPKDSTRIADIKDLIDRGWSSQVLISTDICMKFQLRRYGGHGYAHVPNTIVPFMRAASISEEALEIMMVDTPKRLLAITEAAK